jgi:glycosyltransferase involved in cell wall biosynthesis
MSTYNGEKYIELQLKSLLWQTMMIDEVIIIDDASTDNTLNIIKNFVDRNRLNNSWKLIRNIENKGWRVNFIEGIQYVNGDILFFSDQDDIWFKNKVEMTYNCFKKNPQIKVIGTDEKKCKSCDVDHELCGSLIANQGAIELVSLETIHNNYFMRCLGCTMAIKTNYYQSIHPYYANDVAHDDFFWKFAVIDNCMAMIHSITILHRIHQNNESLKKNSRKFAIRINLKNLALAKKLHEYISDHSQVIENVEKKKKIVEHKYKGEYLRMRFYNSYNLLYGLIIIIKYRDLYNTAHQLIGDFILALNLHRVYDLLWKVTRK